MTEENRTKKAIADGTKEKIRYLYDFQILKKIPIKLPDGKIKYKKDPKESQFRELFMSAKTEIQLDNIYHDVIMKL